MISWVLVSPFLSPADSFKAPQRSVEKPFRLCVSDVFKGQWHQSTLAKPTTHFITRLTVTIRVLSHMQGFVCSSRTPARFLVRAVFRQARKRRSRSDAEPSALSESLNRVAVRLWESDSTLIQSESASVQKVKQTCRVFMYLFICVDVSC